VDICRTGDQVEEFCRRVCVKLECCPNLVSPLCLADVPCPDNCRHLSKTKFSKYRRTAFSGNGYCLFNHCDGGNATSLVNWSTDLCLARRDGQCSGREAQYGRRTKTHWPKTAQHSHAYPPQPCANTYPHTLAFLRVEPWAY